MKISLALVAASALAAITAPALAQADVGFPGAVVLCREAVPTRTLLSIETRIRNGILVYEGDLYNATATLKSTPRINAATGAVIRIDNDTAAADETAQAQAILARLGEAQLDFADAIGFANGAAGHFDVERVKFEIEAGILAFRVEYFDGSTYDIDAATGGVIPHHGADDDMEATLPTTAVLPAISAAETVAGAGWKTIGLETEAEKGGNLVEVLLLNPNTGMLGLATVVGAEVSSFVQFAPAGGQVGQAARIITALPLIQVSASGAVSAAEAAYPGAGIKRGRALGRDGEDRYDRVLEDLAHHGRPHRARLLRRRDLAHRRRLPLRDRAGELRRRRPRPRRTRRLRRSWPDP